MNKGWRNWSTLIHFLLIPGLTLALCASYGPGAIIHDESLRRLFLAPPFSATS